MNPHRAGAGQHDDDGGRIVVTRFECRRLSTVLLVAALHVRLSRAIRTRVTGLIGMRLYVDRRRRVLYNVSLWRSFNDVYSMGSSPAHVRATHLITRLPVQTSCGVYSFAGDWRRLMFGSAPEDESSGALP